MMLPLGLFSQTDQKLNIPLSNPGSKGYLKIGLLYGSITVNAHSGNDVIVETKSRAKKPAETTVNGLKKISNSSGGFSVEEDNNKVTIKSGPNNKKMDFTITVPKNFSLKLSAVNDGNIWVNGVSGDMEISNTNGAITLEDIGGSVIADALNRDIIVTFDSVDYDAPMAFTSLNGNLDVTFPSDYKADVKARTENGNVYTDFEMNQRTSADVDQKRNSKGVYKVTVDKWISGEINGGGPEILFKTLNGNVIIRKK
ncbi:MAG: hypothetical protein ED555_01980 [Allomuricauda sp.]|nr:MAG: hypothetical protein ED555_01980 [Allomuricauda sp.]